MTKKVLVTYSSFTGSTAGIAEEIGRIIEAEGHEINLLAMTDVEDLTGYDALVIGSAIQKGAWLLEAQAFVRQFSGQIKKIPTAMFSVCMTLAMKSGEQYRSGVMDWVGPMRALIQPDVEEIFAGVLNVKMVPDFGERLKFRLAILFGIWKAGDNRDWGKIRAWGNSLKQSILAG